MGRKKCFFVIIFLTFQSIAIQVRSFSVLPESFHPFVIQIAPFLKAVDCDLVRERI